MFSQSAIWLISALVILGIEMLLGTIYLLALCAGALCGAIFAMFHTGLSVQFSVCGAVTIAGIILAFIFRRRIKKLHSKQSNEASNPDKGRTVEVLALERDGSARVSYRGATWTAVARQGRLSEGIWIIEKADGPRLILDKKADVPQSQQSEPQSQQQP